MSLINTLAGPNGLILLGALISTAGVIWSSIDQSAVNIKLTSQGETIIFQSQELAAKTSQLYEKNEEIIKKGNELAEKSNTIEKLNEEVLGHTTGGDSFPELLFTSIDNSSNTAYLTVSNSSEKFNVLDVQMRISDLDDNSQRTMQNIYGIDVVIELPFVKAKTVSLNKLIHFGAVNSKRYNVFTFTRNNDFTQLVRLKKVDGIWLKASKIESGNELVDLNVDEGYPLNADGKVDW